MLIAPTNVRAQRYAAGETEDSGHIPGVLRNVGADSLMTDVSKVVDKNTPAAVDVSHGHGCEISHFEKSIDETKARIPQIQEAVADKGFDGEPQRRAFETRNITLVIPYRANKRKRKRVNRKAYAERNKIERLIGSLKEFCRIASRSDKLNETFLGITQLDLELLCLKPNLIVNSA